MEFTYNDGEISNLVCSCFCSCACKHQFAAMLQLKECPETISREYSDKYNGYFTAVEKALFAGMVFGGRQTGQFNIL